MRKHHDNISLHNLAVTYEEIGNAHVALGNFKKAIENYDNSLVIREELSRPGNVFWQNELVASGDRIGDILFKHNRFDDALTAYHYSLTIREALAQKIPR